MDILNWLYLAKNKFVRTTLSSTKDLMIFGANVGFSKRGDKYQNYAMSAEDFTTSVADVVKPYKVYTALLTQSGGDFVDGQDSGLLTIGVTYQFTNPSPGIDFSNVGAPNNDGGTYFVATGTTPNSWGANEGGGDTLVIYNTGAPVVTVLENTIGNVWFTYQNQGIYKVDCDNGFTINKTTFFSTPSSYYANNIIETDLTSSLVYILSYSLGSSQYENDMIFNTPIEIRVYN